MNKLYYLFFLLFFVLRLPAFGQIGEGGLPPSFIQPVKLRTSTITDIPNYEVPINFDIDRLIWEDSIARVNHGSQRLAQSILVNLNIDSTGVWTKFDDSNIWQQTISAKKAKGLILSYKDFYIPKGGKLFIYNEDKSQLLGGYNHDTHKDGGLFATEMIIGESVTLEYVASSISDEKPRLIIDELGYVYDERLLVRTESIPKPNFNTSASCMININCPDGSLWQKQKRGVVMIMFKKMNNSNWWLCSGSLVNNTSEDGAPLFLTASHCLENGGIPEQTIFYFNYESETCFKTNQLPETTRTLVGAEILMQSPINHGGDGCLMRITSNIPEDWHPYYNGWDIRNVAANRGVVIHHPSGDVKKITTYIKPLTEYTYSDRDNNVGASNAHWRVYYDGRSITEGGSSGSPIFNEKGLIVGSLSGGATYCNKLSEFDLFAKLSYNWEQYALDSGNTFQKMKTYLDPLNKGVLTIEGFDPNLSTGIDDERVVDLKELVVFPNPAEYELNINTNSIIKKLRICDLNGRVVYKIDNYNSSTITIPISAWQKGVYTISLQTELKKITDKFIKK